MAAEKPPFANGRPASGEKKGAGVRTTRWSESPEAEVVEAARAGDGSAFDELVQRHMKRAFAVAYRLLGHREDAEDLVQDAFFAAISKIDQFDVSRPFGPWLMRIVFNRGLNQRKARALRRTEAIPETTPMRGASPLEAAERRELRERMTAALAELPERRRMIVELFDLEGFSGPEIAEILDMPEGTVRWELHQARGALRGKLQTLSNK